MRVEDNQLEVEVAREDEVAALEAAAPPDRERATDVDTSALHFVELTAVIEALLHGDELDVSALQVGDHERAAIAYLAAAISGRDQGRFVYAEDRLSMLNQALAVLQPVLAVGAMMGAPLRDSGAAERYHQLVADVGELRASLDGLTDAQEEVFAHPAAPPLARDEDDTPPDAGDAGAEPRPTTLVDGPEVTPEARPSTLVGGPEVTLEARPTTLVGGPEVTLEARPSTLYDEAAPAASAAPAPKPAR